MTKPIFGASHKRGVELAAAGCPLDYPEAIRDSDAEGEGFWAKQLGGYAESFAYGFGDSQTGFVIGVRLGTNRGGGTEIVRWNFEPPWPEHHICWEYEPADIIPALHMGSYRQVLDSRLSKILNDRCLLQHGFPVDGLLCGYSNQPVPESGKGLAAGELTLVDNKNYVVSVRIDLRICQAAATRSGKTLRPGRGPLFAKVDHIPVGRKRV
jgi:hypothetical protein